MFLHNQLLQRERERSLLRLSQQAQLVRETQAARRQPGRAWSRYLSRIVGIFLTI
mgnify:CR=1 FL=1